MRTNISLAAIAANAANVANAALDEMVSLAYASTDCLAC